MDASNPTNLEQAALWTQIIFYGVTASSIIAAGIVATVKYKLFRSGRPFVTVSLAASSRPCSPGYTQIGVTAQLHNGSKVLAKANLLEWECLGLATYSDEQIDAKIGEYFDSQSGSIGHATGNREFPWNVQQRITKRDLIIAIEPNETSQDNVTFVVPNYCTAVQIRLFIPTRPGSILGWTAVIYHDISVKED